MKEVARYPVWSLIRQARRQAGMSQRELATRAGTSQSAVARYEKARAMPDIPTLYRLISACGFDLRLHLAEPDTHDADLIRHHRTLTPAQRAEINEGITELIARAADQRKRGPLRRAVDA